MRPQSVVAVSGFCQPAAAPSLPVSCWKFAFSQASSFAAWLACACGSESAASKSATSDRSAGSVESASRLVQASAGVPPHDEWTSPTFTPRVRCSSWPK